MIQMHNLLNTEYVLHIVGVTAGCVADNKLVIEVKINIISRQDDVIKWKHFPC